MWLDCVGRTKGLIGMRTYLIFRPLAAVDEHPSLCDPSSAGLDVGCRRHFFIFEAVSEVEIFLAADLLGVMMHGALCYLSVRGSQGTQEVTKQHNSTR